MVIFSALLLGLLAPAPSVNPPPTEIVVDVRAPSAGTAPFLVSVTTRSHTEVIDPFAASGPRVALSTPSAALQDPFAAANVAARFRRAVDTTANLRDPFAS